jgi:hypothetical protein
MSAHQIKGRLLPDEFAPLFLEEIDGVLREPDIRGQCSRVLKAVWVNGW